MTVREGMGDLGVQTNKDIPYLPTTVTNTHVEIPTINPVSIRQCIVCNSTTYTYGFICEECKGAIMYARRLRKVR